MFHAPRRFASWHLTLLPGLVVAALVLSAWLLLQGYLHRQIHQQVGAQTPHRARLVAQNLATHLDERVRQIEQLARDQALQQGQPLKRQQALLDLVVQGTEGIAWIGLVEPNGEVRAGSERLLEGTSIAARPVYQQGRTGLFVGGLHRAVALADLLQMRQGTGTGTGTGTSQDLALADVSLPLLDESGHLSAVLAVHLQSTWFERLVRQSLADTDADSGLHVVVLGADGVPVLGERAAWGIGWPHLALPPAGASAALASVDPSTGDLGTLGTLHGGGGVALARSHLPSPPGRPTLDWQVVVWQSLDQAEAPATRFLRHLAIGGAALVLLFGTLGHLVARRVLQPYLSVFDRLAADPSLAAQADAPGLTPRLDALLRDTLDKPADRHDDPPGARMLQRIGADIARLRELLDSLPVAVMLQDDLGRWHHLNPLAAHWLGHDAAGLIGQTPDTSGLNLSPAWFDALHRATDTHEPRTPHSGWIDLPAAPGASEGLTLHWTRQRLSGNRPHDTDRAATADTASSQAWLTVLSNVSAEVRERRQSALAAAAFEQQMALALVDADSRMMRANRSLGELLGYEPAWLAGQLLTDFEAEVRAPGWRALLARELALTGRWSGASRLRRRDGSHVPVWCQVSRIPDDGAGGTVDVVSMLDLSERQQAEQALRDTQAELIALARRLIDQEHTVSRRIAQALHDQLGQTLTAAALQLDLLQGDTPATPVHQSLERLLRKASVEVRQILIDLRPPLIEAHGLAAALDNEQRLWHPSAASQGTQLSLHVSPAVAPLRWPAEVEYAAFMIAREAIVNAMRHARPATISCEIDGDAHTLRLTVRDDGLGFYEPEDPQARPSAIRAGHIGLVGMRERALAIGATCRVRTHPGEGTQVMLQWTAP